MAAAVASPQTQASSSTETYDIEYGSNDSYTLSLSQEELPSEDTLKTCNDMIVEDRAGNSHKFQSLYASESQRTLFVFVRHFGCGVSAVSKM